MKADVWMYHYEAFGLDITSEMCIPELSEGSEGRGDVTIRYGSVPKPSFDYDNQHAVAFRESKGDHVYYIRDIGGIHVVDGKDIVATPLDGAEDRGFRFLVSGIGLGLLLHQRGLVTLHASAVAIQGQTVGFVGPKGMGKSTTAAALHARGYPVVTDDLLVLNPTSSHIEVRPGPSHLKLHPSSIKDSLSENPDQIPKIDPQGSKRSYRAQSEHLSDSLPLRCLYLLDYEREGSLPRSQSVRGDQACMELIRHSYIPRLLPEEAKSSEHLKRCAGIARAVPISRLYRKKSTECLPDLVSHIEQEQKPRNASSERDRECSSAKEQ